MVEKPEYLALINPVPALSEAAQSEMLAPYQPAEKFVVGKDGDYDQFIRLVRSPRVVLVAYPAMLGEQRGSAGDRRDSMAALKVAIHKRYSYVRDAEGRRSDKNWPAMRAAGKAMCGRLAQGRKSQLNAKRGAKPWNPTPENRRRAREEWFSKRHATIDDAVRAIKKLLGKEAPGRTVLYREFGSPYAKSKR